MMIRLGNFLFKYRNLVFPLLFFLMILGTKPFLGNRHTETWIYVTGFLIALSGQVIRALTIGLAYIVRGGRDKKVYADTLVTNGIFAHCRNPLYLGNILIVSGLGLDADSAVFYFIGIPFFVLAYMAIIKAEENFLSGKFGEEYRQYCGKVNSLIPDLSGIGTTLKSMTFNWRRLLVKEYGTTYAWITIMILLIVKNQYLRNGHKISGPVIWFSSSSFIAATIFYSVVRYLKKTRRLVGDK
ncbi:MAG: methyltransferase family protein [Candidatus Deferrimicrobiaceae bacterium]